MESFRIPNWMIENVTKFNKKYSDYQKHMFNNPQEMQLPGARYQDGQLNKQFMQNIQKASQQIKPTCMICMEHCVFPMLLPECKQCCHDGRLIMCYWCARDYFELNKPPHLRKMQRKHPLCQNMYDLHNIKDNELECHVKLINALDMCCEFPRGYKCECGWDGAASYFAMFMHAAPKSMMRFMDNATEKPTFEKVVPRCPSRSVYQCVDGCTFQGSLHDLNNHMQCCLRVALRAAATKNKNNKHK